MVRVPEGAQVLPDAEAVARAAAERLIAACGEAQGERIAICLSGGSTPKRLYALLAGPDYAALVPWTRIHWFFGDDRAVPWDDARSNVRMVREAFGHGSEIPPTHLHFMPSDEGIEAGAKAYERTLLDFHGADALTAERPLFDLVLLGLGEDGHTASLFPGKPEAGEATALAVPVPEAGLDPFVPRISLTVPALTSARHVLFLVTGAGKREPLARLAAGEDLPAGAIRGPQVVWLLDEAAAG